MGSRPDYGDDEARATADVRRSMQVLPLPTLRQQVTDRIREAIETGEFAPGSRLVERDLCERMGVSRTSSTLR